MSRVGKKPIIVPSGVEVTINGNVVTVKGPKGTLTKEFNSELTIKEVKGEAHHHAVNEIVVERPNDLPAVRAIHGTTRALINNMILGVSQGFRKTLWRERVRNNSGFRARYGKKFVREWYMELDVVIWISDNQGKTRRWQLYN